MLFNKKIWIMSTIGWLPLACSTGTLTGGDIAKRDKKPAVTGEKEEATVQPSGETTQPDNEYLGTVDEQMIAAAYLACGKDSGTLGCNVYNRSDQRIAYADQNGTWTAQVNNRTVQRRSSAIPKVSFVGGLPFAPMPGDVVSVSYSIPRGATISFQNRVANLPPISALSVFGRVAEFETTPSRTDARPPSDSNSMVSTITTLRGVSRDWSFCDPFSRAISSEVCRNPMPPSSATTPRRSYVRVGTPNNQSGSITDPDTSSSFEIKQGLDEPSACENVLQIFLSALCS